MSKKLSEERVYFHKYTAKPETEHINSLGWSTLEWLKIWDVSTNWYQRYTNASSRTERQERTMMIYLSLTPVNYQDGYRGTDRYDSINSVRLARLKIVRYLKEDVGMAIAKPASKSKQAKNKRNGKPKNSTASRSTKSNTRKA